MNISSITHTRNSEATLDRLLESIRWIDDKIVVDMESTDRTAEIARRHNAKLHSIPKSDRVDGVRNQFLGCAAGEWVFVLDSDEYLAADAEKEIARLISTHGSDYDAFAIPRYNEIAGQRMRGSLWYPDWQIRLFKKGTVCWSDSTHKPPTVLSGEQRLLKLEPPHCLHIHHLNYPTLNDFIQRQLRYALNDNYDLDPSEFSFDQYIGGAYRQFSARLDAKDGDLSFALASVMAWDQIVRGLIHWEKLGCKPDLSRAFSLPIAVLPQETRQAAELSRRNKELEAQLEAVRSGILWKTSNWLEQRLPRAKRFLKRVLRTDER